MTVHLEDWGPDDLPLVEAIMGDPAMTEHLGGPESPEKLADRQRRYADPNTPMFKIVDDETGQGIGSVGVWDSEHHGEPIQETGWSIARAFQGRGNAKAGVRRLIEEKVDQSRPLYAFPNVTNAASNALCRSLGFELVEVFDGEYPPGNPMRCNVWRLSFD